MRLLDAYLSKKSEITKLPSRITHVLHDIFERGKLILALVAVHSVGDGHQPDIVGREKFFTDMDKTTKL